MRIRTVLVLLLLMLLPAPAHAGWWWDYFDGLSGPGPFKTNRHVPTLEATFWPDAFRGDRRKFLLDNPAPETKWYLAFRVVALNNDDHPQMFEDTPADRRHVDLRTFDFSAMYRVNRVLDLGAGLSFLRFSGEGFEPFYRVGPIGKMTVTPFGDFQTSNARLRWLERVPKFYADVTVVKGFDASEFGNPQNSRFTTKAETKVRAGFYFDVSAIFCAAKGCEIN